MRLTVLFEPRPWIKRWACSRSRTVAPVLHYFRVLRGVLRHHWPINKESPSICNKVKIFFFWPLRVSLKRDTVFSFWSSILVNRIESWCVCAQICQPETSLRTLNQFWKNLYATIPHLSMNDVVNPNTGLYHDQSLFNSTYVAKPLLLVRLFIENRDNTSVQFEKKNIWDDNFFFFKNFGSIRTEARTRDLSRVRRAS